MFRVMIFVLMVFTLMSPSVFAEESQRMVSLTDKSAYVEGEIITISGRINQIISGTPVTLQIFSDKNQIEISQSSMIDIFKFFADVTYASFWFCPWALPFYRLVGSLYTGFIQYP